jgi:hypothetical protein
MITIDRRVFRETKRQLIPEPNFYARKTTHSCNLQDLETHLSLRDHIMPDILHHLALHSRAAGLATMS